MTNTPFSIVVLISGSGSNLQAIIDAIDKKMWSIEIKAVISNKADAYGLTRAQQVGIPISVINHKEFADRNSFDRALMQSIDQYQPDLIVLAGFMRILTADFVQHYRGKMINIHPSLLPAYKGLNTHQRALTDGVQTHGCTVHLVSEDLDAGSIIAQMECEVTTDDTAESLQQKVHQLEHQLLPEVIFWLAEGQVRLPS